MDSPDHSRVLAHLEGVEYPATKDDFIKAAENDGASEDDLDTLRALPREGYQDAAALRADLG